jgi:hypothetical protein
MAALTPQASFNPKMLLGDGSGRILFSAPNPDFAQQVYSSILDHWTVLICQETCPLRFLPADLDDVRQALSPAGLPVSAGGSPDEEISRMDVDMAIEELEVHGSTVDAKVTEVSEREKWDSVRSFLSEERDRLCVWKSNFSGADLNQIADVQSGLLGSLVLESLVGIAEALAGLTSEYTLQLGRSGMRYC